jgi:hypothetical protein
MRRENLYSSCMIEFLFICSNRFSYIQNEQPTWQYHVTSYRKCLKDFFVLHISRLKKMIAHWIVSKDVLSKALKKLYESVPVANQKSRPKNFDMI